MAVGRDLYTKNAGKLGSLDPDDLNLFQTQRRQANQAFNIGSAQNRYKETNYNQEYAANTKKLGQQYSQHRNQFGSDYVQAGLGTSGLYNQGLRNLRQQRNQAANDLLREYRQQQRGVDLAGRQLANIRQSGLDDVASAEAARRASVAAALKLAKEQG